MFVQRIVKESTKHFFYNQELFLQGPRFKPELSRIWNYMYNNDVVILLSTLLSIQSTIQSQFVANQHKFVSIVQVGNALFDFTVIN